ncbi:MAG: hypothetical protein ACTSXM_05495, partial [Promethearchaeota archaeon]
KMVSINKVLNKDNYDQDLVEDFRKIPVDFLEEQTRFAVIKKLRNTKRTNSDNYFLRKLKMVVEIKLIEAKYYKILKNILD